MSTNTTGATIAPPTLAPGHTWFKPEWGRENITKIIFSNAPPKGHKKGWNASATPDGPIMAYRMGTEITIVGNGAERILANENSYGMFMGLTSLETIENLRMLDTSNVTDMSCMFFACNGLTTLDLSSFDTSNVTDMGSMFHDCISLITLDLSSFNTINVTRMDYMFDGCSSLTTLDLSSLNTTNATDISGMFYGCSSLRTVYASDAWTINAHSYNYCMFTGCTSLMGECGTTWAPGDEGNDWQGACIDTWDHPGFFTRKPAA